jgi:hypothetical protein
MDNKPSSFIDELNNNRLGIRKSEAHLNYYLDVFGDYIAKREGYRKLSGIDAVHYYLIHRFGWLPRDVRSMSPEDLRFVLDQEMDEWEVPEDARKISRQDSLD